MAMNYLEMNEAPRKYRYFDRFIDKAKYDELRAHYISGKHKEEKVIQAMKEIHTDLLTKKKSKKALKELIRKEKKD